MMHRRFYARDTAKVARALLGKRIVRRTGQHELTAIITETEAYGHADDPASHAFGSMTRRNHIMFGTVGMAYVYFTYGMHYCFNIVARSPGVQAGAVLVRAARPESGIDIMSRNRRGRKNIADGPAKLAQALCIGMQQYGTDLTAHPELHITHGIRPGRIIAGPRIGITRATDRLWNFRMA